MIREINVGDILYTGEQLSNAKNILAYVIVIKSKYRRLNKDSTPLYNVKILSLSNLQLYDDTISSDSNNSSWTKL